MLKLLHRVAPHSPLSPTLTRPILNSPNPLNRVINSLRGSNTSNLYRRAFFCSSSDATAIEADAVEDDAKDAILPTVFRPDDCNTVLALPLPHRPLFPGFYMPIYVKDPKLLAALEEIRRKQAPFAGAFLVKDEPDSDPDKKKNIYEYKGKELLNRLHEVGTLGQITAIQGDQVILVGLRRLRITEMVDEYPLTVKVDHLKDLPYDNDDDVIKATSFEVISTVRDVLHKSSLWRDHVQTYTKHIGEFNYPRLADFGAAISGANMVQGQQVLEELDVLKRLQLSLELVKKEMEISKIQETIAKAIEEKISGEQRRYLLNEQLKAIKKVDLTDKALLALTESYCREAGVRNLQKQIEKIYRKIALQLVRQGAGKESVSPSLESSEPKPDGLVYSNGTMIGVDNQNKPETEESLPPKQSDESSSESSDDETKQTDFNHDDSLKSAEIDQNPEKPYSISSISELIAKQHWGKIKDILNGKEKENPSEILNELFDFEADPRVILSYFKWLVRECGFSPDIHVYFKLFHLLSSLKLFGEVRKLLNRFVQSEKYSNSEFFHGVSLCGDLFRVNSVLVDMLVQTYVYNLKVELAVEAVRRAWDYGFRLSVLSCNPLLNVLVDEGKVKVMEDVFKGMIRRRVRPDLRTFNIVISGFCRAGQLQKAGDLLEDIKAWGLSPSVVTYNTLISGHCKKAKVGKMCKADALLKEMVAMNILPSEITFNTLIDGLCKDQNLPGAMKVFKEMQNQGLKPGVVTFNALIRGFCSEGKIDEALGLQDEMFNLGLKPNTLTYNILINGYCKKGMVKEARDILDGTDTNGWSPSVISFNTLIDAYCKAGMMDEVVALQNMMMERNVLPNVSTYNCLIGGFYRSGDFQAANDLLNKMKDIGLKADIVTYNVQVGAICQKGDTRKAAKLLDEMFEMGLRPSCVTYNTLIEGYCNEKKLRAAMNMRTRMEKEGWRANVVTYNVLIKGCCILSKMEEANKLLNEMLEKGLVPNRTTYDIIKEEMMEKGFVPDIDGHLYSQAAVS